MTRSERRLLINTSVLGVLLTLLVAGLDAAGALDALEDFSYDQRARRCQYFQPRPTDKLVHIDIDDTSLEAIGAWAWPRATMAQIVDEIRLAGCQALAFDIIYSERQAVRYEPLETSRGSGPATRPIEALPVADDAIFASALQRFGKAVVPFSLNLGLRVSVPESYRLMVAELEKDPSLDRPALIERLVAQKVAPAAAERDVAEYFVAARKEALYDLIARRYRVTSDPEALRLAVLPGADRRARGTPLDNAFDEQYTRFAAVEALRRFGRPVTPELPPLVASRDEQATVQVLSAAAHVSGYVDYLPSGDGTVRCVPLLANHRDVVYPQMGLALALAMLDVPFADVRFERDRIIIPRPAGPAIEIPTYERATQQGRRGMFFDIPWFGDWRYQGAWETMYDYPAYERPAQHMSVAFIYDACVQLNKIRRNNRELRAAMIYVWNFMDEAQAHRLEALPVDLDDPQALLPLAAETLAKLDREKFVEFWRDLQPEDEETRAVRQMMLASANAVRQAATELPALGRYLEERRAQLRAQLEGKAAIMGWIAVGAIADLVPTSLHPKCPGVVVHGTIFNAIMTNNFWRRAPYGVTLGLIVVLGLITTAMVARLAAWQSIVACSLVGIICILLNGLVLFDRYNLIVGLAGPVTCTMLVWAGCTAARYIQETQERARVRRFFTNYVDPALVDYVLENDVAKLDGQRREITVAFTDLQGFTTLSERLQEKAVPVLNRYMGLMVPIIRRHGGYLNKLLGDGIMFFFNAPRDRPSHVHDAVACVLEMQQAMTGFNQDLQRQELPTLLMRVGVLSGHAIVGNAGPLDRSFNDYTALGDNVNLASRLEGANKAFGTRVLVNDGVYEPTRDRVLYRPVGIVQVVGKTQGIRTWEALSPLDRATEDQKRLAELTAAMVQAFIAGEFAEALAAAEQIEAATGPSKLTSLYAGLCRRYLAAPPAAFTGEISLSEK